MNWINAAEAITTKPLWGLAVKLVDLINSPSEVFGQKHGRVSECSKEENPLQKRNGDQRQNASRHKE